MSPQALYQNPLKDKPTGLIDLVYKINQNQGISSLFRGASAMSLNLALQHTARFMTYDTIKGYCDQTEMGQ